MGLERLLGSTECMLLFQRTWLCFPECIGGQAANICLFDLYSPYTKVVYTHTDT